MGPVVIVGAGIAGVSLACHLARREVGEVLVVDRSPFDRMAGSTAHAPGAVRLNDQPPILIELARRSRDLYATKDAFFELGSVEVGRSESYIEDLVEKVGLARDRGVGSKEISVEELARLYPGLDTSGIGAAYRFPENGLADAGAAVRNLRAEAEGGGVRFVGETEVSDLDVVGDRVTAVRLSNGERIAAATVAVCTGIWGAGLPASVGCQLPLVAVEHPYGKTVSLLPGPEDGQPRRPWLRDGEQLVYLRQHGTRYGVGSYRHAPRPFDADATATAELRLGEDLLPALSCDLLGGVSIETGFSGLFAVTPDELPLVGPVDAVEGLWLGLALWVTHAAGAAESLAAMICGETPPVDLAELSPARFDHLDPAEARQLAISSYSHIATST